MGIAQVDVVERKRSRSRIRRLERPAWRRFAAGIRNELVSGSNDRIIICAGDRDRERREVGSWVGSEVVIDLREIGQR